MVKRTLAYGNHFCAFFHLTCRQIWPVPARTTHLWRQHARYWCAMVYQLALCVQQRAGRRKGDALCRAHQTIEPRIASASHNCHFGFFCNPKGDFRISGCPCHIHSLYGLQKDSPRGKISLKNEKGSSTNCKRKGGDKQNAKLRYASWMDWRGNQDGEGCTQTSRIRPEHRISATNTYSIKAAHHKTRFSLSLSKTGRRATF